MSSTFSWKRWTRLKFPSVVLTVVLAISAHAETANVRLGESFHDLVAYPLSGFGTVGEVLKRLDLGVQAYTRGVENCQQAVAIPFGEEQTYDSRQYTRSTIQSNKVECWAMLQFDPSAAVSRTGKGDGITVEMVLDILDQAEQPSEEREKWKSVASDRSPFDLFWRNSDYLSMYSPGGWKAPEGSFDFYLLVVVGNDSIVEVEHSFEKKESIIYGVRWRKTDTGGEVAEVFPDIDPP